MRNNLIAKKIIGFIYRNFDEDEMELERYIYNNIAKISEEIDIDEYILEEKLDSDSKFYLKIVEEFSDNKNMDIIVEEKGPLYYLVKLSDMNLNILYNYYDKIDFILKNSKDNSKGYIYEEFIIKFLEEIGYEFLERKKVADGGLDILCLKEVKGLIPGIKQKFNLYGQIKFHKEVISTKYLKQLVKDKLYKIIMENNNLIEFQANIFISHKGFSKKAKIYGKNSNMILLDTEDVIRIILKEKKCDILKFIDNEYLKLYNEIM